MIYCFQCEKLIDEEKVFISVTKQVEGCWKNFCRNCVAPHKFEYKPTEFKVGSGRASFPDVFWDGKPEENLADDPRTGKPRVFHSKGQKSAYLKEKGIMEAGDKYHGAPVQISQNQLRKAVDGRHEVQMAIKKVKEMGKDQRHQEYLKIIREGQRHGGR